jgi:hypothetical protein
MICRRLLALVLAIAGALLLGSVQAQSVTGRISGTVAIHPARWYRARR